MNNDKNNESAENGDINQTRGSVEKVAGPNPNMINNGNVATIVMETTKDVNEDGVAGNKDHGEIQQGVDFNQNTDAIVNSRADDYGHEELRDLKYFSPPDLIVVVTMGVVSEHFELSLDHVTEAGCPMVLISLLSLLKPTFGKMR